MPNLKEIRNRISSVTSTMKITSAIKMVSAAKLKKAQDAITAMKPYSEKLNELMSSFTNVISTFSLLFHVHCLVFKFLISHKIVLLSHPALPRLPSGKPDARILFLAQIDQYTT